MHDMNALSPLSAGYYPTGFPTTGPWRWYHESMLDCCAPLETVRKKGITLNTVSVRCKNLSVPAINR